MNDVNIQIMRRAAEAPKRTAYHHGDLRNALLAAALKLIARRGIEGFSLREAARAVGVSAAAAYRHFDDKAALLSELAVDGLARLAVRMEDAVARVPGAPGTAARATAELAAIGLEYVEFAVANPSHFRVMFGPWCDHPQLAELPKERFPGGRDPYQVLVDTLDELVRAGAVPPAAREGAEIAAWSAVHGLASLLVDGALPLDATERAQACGVLLRTLLLGFGAPPALVAPAVAPPRADPRPASRRTSSGGPRSPR